MADSGYDVADYRAIDPAFGTLERGRAADRRGARARHPHDRRRRPEPRLRPAPVVPGGARRRRRARPSARASGSGPAAARTASCRRTAGSRSSAAPAWTRTTTPTDAGRVVPAPLRARAARPQLDAPRRLARARGRPALLVRPRRRRRAHRLGRAARQGSRAARGARRTPRPGEHPFTDRDELHEIYRRWRAIADSYDEPRVLVGEIWLPDAERFARYLRPDELHTAFNFDFLACPWEPGADARARSTSALAAHAPVDAPATWVLSNHDVTRPVTRYGRADTSFAFEAKRVGTPTDLARGTRRARAAALLAMALPGSMYIYQGEELGLPEVEDIPADRRQDPMWLRSGGVDPGRDGCRVPLPWSGDRAAVRLQPRRRGAALARPARRLGAAHRRGAESADAGSMLALYRAGLRAAPRRRRGRATRPALARPAPTTCSPSRAASASPASSTSARSRSTPGRRRASSSPATSSKEVRCRRTPRSGCARQRTRPSRTSPTGTAMDRSTRYRTGTATRCTREGEDDEVHPYGQLTAAVTAASLLAVCATAHRGRQRSAARERHGHDQRRVADPRQHEGGDRRSSTTRSRSSRRPTRRSRSSRSQYQWTGPTFAAKLAAGTLPTVFTVPFTDGRTLGDNGQLADLTSVRQGAAVLQEVQPGGHRRGHRLEAARSSPCRPPRYAQALHYNRELFTQAGLDPNKPPTTWAQVAADAKQIAAEDRQGRLRRDGQGRQHRRLDPDHARLRARRPHGDGHRHEGDGDARQPADRRRR